MTWVRIELTADDIAEAERIALLRQRESDCGGFKANRGTGTLANHRIGARGEMAAAKFLSVPHPLHGQAVSFSAEHARGWDVGGYEVRSVSRAWYGLKIRDTDKSRDPDLKMMLVLTHNDPVMWIAGWTTLREALKNKRPVFARGYWLSYVPVERLKSFTEDRWLIDPQTPFWCETCTSMHPLREHRDCRSGLHELLLERSRRVRNLLYPPTEDRTQ